LQEDTDETIHLRNVSVQPAASEEEALNMLFIGDTNKMIAETPSNPASSRSHCIFVVTLSSRRHGEDRVRKSKLHLVDLAG
jgi:kinesin family protein 6/9